MIVLGLDTATSASAVALRLGDGSVRELRDDPPAGAHPGHATRLLEMARTLLGQAGLRWGELERIAAGVGPGTFTGLRVGVATARGLAQSLGIEPVGVSSLRALAVAVGTERGTGESVLAVIDARRGEVFAAAYERRGEGAPRELGEPAAYAPEALGAAAAELARPRDGGGGWIAVGDGAVRYRAALELASIEVPDGGSALHRVSAAAICALAVESGPVSAGIALLPDYRRRPDAELALAPGGSGA